MVAAVELTPDQVRRLGVDEAPETNGLHGQTVVPPATFRFSSGRPFRLTEFSTPLRHKPEAVRPGRPDYAALEVPLHVRFDEPSGLWLWTPEDLRGFRFHLYVKGGQGSTRHLSVKLEPAGMPVAEVYANARFLFLYALHAGSGDLVFTMLEPRRERFKVAELPLIPDQEVLAQLEAQLRFLDDLVHLQ